MLGFIFELGVLIAIYSFFWFFFEMGVQLLSAGRKRSIIELYSVRAVRYFLLVNVVFLFCMEVGHRNLTETTLLSIAGLVLFIYFLGKFQNSQNRMMRVQMFRDGVDLSKMPLGKILNPNYNTQAEIIVISIALVCFVGFLFFPNFAYNPVSLWYAENISKMGEAPIFGFIFKVIGFFFTLNLLLKLASGLTFLVSGGASQNRFNQNNNQNDDDFTDYKEVD